MVTRRSVLVGASVLSLAATPVAAQETREAQGPQPSIQVAASLDAYAAPAATGIHDASERPLREGEILALGYDPARFERADLQSQLGVVSTLTASRRFGGLRLEAEASTLQNDVSDGEAFAILRGAPRMGADASNPDIGLSVDEVMGRAGKVETRAGYLNGYYDLDTGRSDLTAHLGAGLGAAEVDLWYAPQGGTGGDVIIAQTDRVAAFQLMAGGRYEVSKKAELLFGARYRGLAGGAGADGAPLRVESGGLIAELGYKARF